MGTSTGVPTWNMSWFGGVPDLVSRTRLLAAIAALFGAIILLLTYSWFISPAQDEPQVADAVVMLGGGSGERLQQALDLMDQELAPALVLINGRSWSKGVALCLSDDEPFEVICPAGVPNTRGEAREIRALAAERGWESINLVTSDYHIHRASTNVGRCFEGTIHRVAAEDDFGLSREAYAIAREWFGTVRNVVRRGC